MERKILKASAGTGKTYRLSLEYAVALFNGEKIKDIVVMTFTRKAVGEIKEDIVKFLKKLASKSSDEKDIKEKEAALESILKIYPDLFSKEEICEKAERAYKDIVLNKDNLKIFTIDGLKNKIFKMAIAPMLNIDSYSIIEDNQNTEYLRKCFERIFKNKEDFNILKSFLENNIERDADKYVEVIKNIIKERWKILVINKAERKRYEVTGVLDQLDKSVEVLESIFQKKGKSDETIKSFITTDYHSYLEKSTQEEKEKFIYDNWNMIFKKEMRNKRKTGTTKKINVDEENEKLSELYEDLLKNLAERIYNDTVLPYEENILSFLEKVYSVYDEIKFKEKKFTQEDITNYTFQFINDKRLNLVDENGITSYMKDILESGITTFYIDEFQDTSVVQWKIFKSMIENAEKVICVGDEKQSIYGWRGGDKDLFVNLSKITGGTEETLGTSYRSRKKITEFTNKFFEKYSSYAKSSEINWDFEPVESSDDKNRGYVEIYNGSDLKDENPLEKIIEILQERFNGNYRDVCILARKNDMLQEMAELLRENRIPYFLETNLDIFSHRTTQPIVKLMKYFAYNNKFYLAEFLRDDFMLISDKNLKEILMYKDDLNDFRFSDEKLNETYEKIKGFRKKYEENQGENIDLLSEVIKEIGILNVYKSETDVQNIYNFIDVSKRFLNIREFLNEIEENSTASEYKQSSIEVQNAVSLMTVHKSKGLGFDTVFYIHKETPSKSNSGVQFNIHMSEDYNVVEDYIIINSKYEKILKHLSRKYDYLEEKKLKRKEEDINNHYVAFTRSKQNLFIIISSMTKESSFRKIMSENFLSENTIGYGEGVFEREESDNYTDKMEKDFPSLDLDFSKYNYDEEKLAENRIKLAEEEERYSSERGEKREIGNIVHYFLENLIYNEENERKEAEKNVIIKYGASFGKDNIIGILESNGIRSFLSENEEIFSKKWDYIYPEYAIYSDEDNKLYRIDRLMIKLPKDNEKGEILIVDYKTGSYEESQLENYYRAVRARLKNPEDYIMKKRYLKIDL